VSAGVDVAPTVGQPDSDFEIYRGLDIPKEDALAMCDALVESGHLMQAEQVTRNNRTLTVAYTVVSTDPGGSVSQPPVES
jgi:hypothetical protein